MNVTNPRGLRFAFSHRGALQSIEADPIRISMTRPGALSRPAATVYLRRRGAQGAHTPLFGPGSPARFRADGGMFEASGSWDGLDYVCLLQPAKAERAWQWRIAVTSTRADAVELDLIFVQDVGLRAMSQDLVNEHYVSQYLERRVFEDGTYGAVVCCRQNAREPVGHPWLMLACASGAIAASTDGSQFYGRSYRATGVPEALDMDRLGGELAGESSVVALQARPFVLRPSEARVSSFVATYLPDHPQASSEEDLARLPALVSTFAAAEIPTMGAAFATATPSRLEQAPLLPAEDLTEDDLVAFFGSVRRQVEEREGALLSFFTDGPRHVVLREKELRVLRPHGHIVQAKAGCVPDERTMSTTAFACGVFNAHVTQGNTNFNTFLAVCTNPATPTLASGQRIVVEGDDGPYLLGVPSAFEMGLNHCRWIYKLGRTCLQVVTWTAPDAPRVNLHIDVLGGGPLRLTLVHHLDHLNGWTVAPHAPHELVARPRGDGVIAGRFPTAQFRVLVNTSDAAYTVHGGEALGLPDEADRASFFVFEVARTNAFGLSFIGEVDGPHEAARITDADAQRLADCEAAAAGWRAFSRALTVEGGGDVAAIGEILPWYGMNALVHFLTPYGLEQFSGAAWGTRDVCQGPIELLLCQEKYDEAREVLRIIFSNQNPDGGWPQWWMFDRHHAIRADSAHGDVVYWCILALCSYVRASGDFAILDECWPYFHADGAEPSGPTSLSEHVDRIFALVSGTFVPGTALVQFGGGDWNDSLQPVSKDLARRLISSWTVQMCYQAFDEYGEVCARAGMAARAHALKETSARILADFHRHLVKDGVVAGYGLVGTEGRIEVLLHPTDQTTGVSYSLLPMDRGVISGVFSQEQATAHAAVIERHLKGPDGARLMDRPLRYRGGLQTIFQRAESSTYFGREIGLMYVHEHLRYAELQARLGKPEAFLRALRQAIPVAYSEVVPEGSLRQANCYYSSSDVVFRSRYEADVRYDDVVAGRLPLEGGWRVYSSGPGIYVALVVSRLLGLRVTFGMLVIDPVLTSAQDGLEATLQLRGQPVTFRYRVAGKGFGPTAISINGAPVPFEREDNRYREGGAAIPLEQLSALFGPGRNSVEVFV